MFVRTITVTATPGQKHNLLASARFLVARLLIVHSLGRVAVGRLGVQRAIANVAELHLHRRSGVQLKCKQAAHRAFVLLIVGQVHRHVAVDRQHDVIAVGDDLIVIPILLLNRSQNLRLGCRLVGRLLLALGRNLDTIASLGQDAAALFLIQGPRPTAARVEVGLVTGDHPLVDLATAKLNAGIPADDTELQLQLEVSDLPVAPHQERIAASRIFLRRLPGDHALLDAPKFLIAFPALERFSVEQRSKTAFFGASGGGQTRNHGKAQQGNRNTYQDDHPKRSESRVRSHKWFTLLTIMGERKFF